MPSLEACIRYVVDHRIAFGLPTALIALLIYASFQRDARFWLRYAKFNRLSLAIGSAVLGFVWLVAYQEHSLFCYVIGTAGGFIGMLIVLTDYSQQRVAWSTEQSPVMLLARRRAAAVAAASSSTGSSSQSSMERQSERTTGLVSVSPMSTGTTSATVVRQRQQQQQQTAADAAAFYQ